MKRMVKLDFRVVPPKKRHSTFYKEDVYIIPCRVLSIGERINGKVFNIEIEILDFANPVLKKVEAITYEGSLGYFTRPPFITECVIRKIKNNHFKLIVYNKSNPGLIEKLFGVKQILNTEDEIVDFYNYSYKELRNWLFETEERQEEDIDLPF